MCVNFFLVVYYYGKNVWGGYYMSDVCYLIYGWIRIDDIRFKVVLVNYVFKFI